MNKFSTKESGQSVFEVLIAIGIFAISATAAFQIFFGGQKLSIDSANSNLANDYGREAVEAIRNIRARNWSELTDGAHGLVFKNNEWMFGSSSVSESQDIFTRTVTVGTVDANTKIATTTITWQSGDNRIQTQEIVEKITNWESYSQSSCKNEPLTGNWAAPVLLGSGDIGSGNSGTDVVVRLPYAFVSGTASTASKPDIFVFDVSNPALPLLVQSLNIGANGISSLYISGNYLYAASPNDSKELIVFDITNPTSLTEIGSYNLSGSADALSVIVFGNTAAVGRTDGATNEIAFLNISTPSAPTLIREDPSNGGDVYDMAATDKYLYITSKESDEDIYIYDITNPTNPAYVTFYDIPGTTEDVSVYIQIKSGGTNLLIGNIGDEFMAIGATTTNQMYVRGRIGVGGDVNDIVCVTGDLAFLATNNSTKEFIIVNVANLDAISEYASLNFPQNGTGIDFVNNMVFMSVKSNDSLRIITSQ